MASNINNMFPQSASANKWQPGHFLLVALLIFVFIVASRDLALMLPGAVLLGIVGFIRWTQHQVRPERLIGMVAIVTALVLVGMFVWLQVGGL